MKVTYTTDRWRPTTDRRPNRPPAAARRPSAVSQTKTPSSLSQDESVKSPVVPPCLSRYAASLLSALFKLSVVSW